MILEKKINKLQKIIVEARNLKEKARISEFPANDFKKSADKYQEASEFLQNEILSIKELDISIKVKSRALLNYPDYILLLPKTKPI